MGTKEILNKLDKARTQGYHFVTIIVSGMGFFTDAFDLFCISMLTKLLGRIYYYDASTGEPGTLPSAVNAAVTGVALVGTLIGQIFFGYMGDKVGRQKVYGITLGLMIVCSLGSASAFGSASTVMTVLCFFRFWLGFGIGGDYPLSATIMSEYSSTNSRGRFIAAVFAMQGIGILFACILTLVVSWIFMVLYPSPTFAEDPVASTPPQADYVWRLVFALGCIPAILTMYHRLNLPETARYTALVKKNAGKAAMDMSKVMSSTGLNIPTASKVNLVEMETGFQKTEEFGLFSQQFWKKFGLMLLGTCSCWFFLDVAFYSQNLFQKDLFSAIGFLPDAADMSALQEVYLTARAQALVAMCGTVPGYWVTVATIEKLGRFKIQLGGFFFMTLFTGILAGDYNNIKEMKWTFLGLYTLTFFFANFGPNSTTFVVPAELFPARFRSTCHGISAASGKLGAILGAFGFVYLLRDPPLGIGVQNTLFVLVFCGVCGFCLTFMVPETKGKTLEELSGELELENSEEEEDKLGPPVNGETMTTHLNPSSSSYSSLHEGSQSIAEASELSNDPNQPLIDKNSVAVSVPDL